MNNWDAAEKLFLEDVYSPGHGPARTDKKRPKGLLIHNLKAGSLDAKLFPKLVSALGEVASVSIEELGEAGNALRYAKANHCDWIAVAGGDGTVESVASTLVGTTLPLGVIPAGCLRLGLI